MTQDPEEDDLFVVFRTSRKNDLDLVEEELDLAAIEHWVELEALQMPMGPLVINELGRAYVVKVAEGDAEKAVSIVQTLGVEDEADLLLLQPSKPRAWADRASKIFICTVLGIFALVVLYSLLGGK